MLCFSICDCTWEDTNIIITCCIHIGIQVVQCRSSRESSLIEIIGRCVISRYVTGRCDISSVVCSECVHLKE